MVAALTEFHKVLNTAKANTTDSGTEMASLGSQTENMERTVEKANQEVHEIGPADNDAMRLQRLATEVWNCMADKRGTVEEVNNNVGEVDNQHQLAIPQALLHQNCARFEVGTPIQLPST